MRDTASGGKRRRRGSGHRLTAAAVAVAAAVASLAPLAGGTAVAADARSTRAQAQARTPEPLTIPAERFANPGVLQFAGASGFLHQDSLGYAWVSYADGRTVRYEDSPSYKLHSGGGDTIVREYYGSPARIGLQDGPGGPERTVTIAPYQYFHHVENGRVLAGSTKAVHVYTIENGVQKERTVPAPAGSEWMSIVYGQSNGQGFFVVYSIGGVKHTAWVDLDELVLRPTGIPYDSGYLPVVGTRAYTWDNPAKRLKVWDLAGDTSRPVVDMALPSAPVTLVGDEVLAGTRHQDGGGGTYRLFPLDGGESRPAFEAADLVTALDGGVLATVRDRGGAFAVHRVRFPADGSAPVLTKVYDAPGAIRRTTQLAMAQGELHASETVGMNDMYGEVTSRGLSLSGDLAAGPKVSRGYDHEGVVPGPCRTYCAPVVPSGDGRLGFYSYPGTLHVAYDGKTLDEADWSNAEARYDIQLSGRYATYSTYAKRREVYDMDTKKVLSSRAFGDRLVSLDGTTLWAESTVLGTVDAVDARTGATRRTVRLAGCDLTGLQVVGSFAYWKCATGAGVRNLDTSADVPLPQHTKALLGDGYVVHERAGTLSLTPLRGGGATRVIGSPRDPGKPGDRWAVDRFGGPAAYVDADDAIHVVPSGVPASPLRLVDVQEPSGILDRRAAKPEWTGTWWLSKPAASWRVEFTDASGAVVRTVAGAEARGVVKPSWDGEDTAGTALPDGLYGWRLTAVPADGVGPALTRTGDVALVRGASSLATGRYEPVTPARLMDSRDGTGVPKARIGAGRTVSLTVAGRGGVPLKGVSAVVLNVTATNPTASTFVSVYPYGTTRTSASNLNVPAGRTVPNLVVVPVRDGKVTFYNRNGSTDLIADVAGYYTLAGKGSLYQPLTPARLMDTRDGTGVAKARIGADRTVSLTVAGRVGVPATGVTAVVLNVTATNPTASTFVSVYPYGTTRTSASNLNVTAGQTIANLVIVPVRDGKVTFYNRNGSTDLIADVAGYYDDGTEGSLYEPVTPARLMDTRDGTGVAKARIGAGRTVTLTVAGRGGVPATGVTAVVLNVTATNPTASTFVSVYPYGTTRTSASNLNVTAGQTIANLVIVPVRDGKVTFYNRNGSTDLIADVAGFYGP